RHGHAAVDARGLRRRRRLLIGRRAARARLPPPLPPHLTGPEPTNRRETSMKRALLKATAATAIAMVGMGGQVGVASAEGQGGTPVAGLLEPDTDSSCTANPDAAAAYDVSGSLNGCWYVDEFIYKNESNAGGFVATG